MVSNLVIVTNFEMVPRFEMVPKLSKWFRNFRNVSETGSKLLRKLVRNYHETVSENVEMFPKKIVTMT